MNLPTTKQWIIMIVVNVVAAIIATTIINLWEHKILKKTTTT